MILLTGAAGFIGSCLLSDLIQEGKEVVICDDFSISEKEANYVNKAFKEKVEREALFDYLEEAGETISFVLHIGARTDTTDPNKAIFDKLNFDFTQKLWKWCVQKAVPMIYASSAATYGNGDLGFEDRHDIIESLLPLNEYARSKNNFDCWAIKEKDQPPFWAGLKFFNVYGPNEYHKGRMASVVWHAFNQIKKTGKMRLFRSHNPEFKDGEQRRDFVYVKDLIAVCLFLMEKRPSSGLYNLGTGKAETFKHLVDNLFLQLALPEHIEFIDTPEDIRENYQYFTEASIDKLRSVGYEKPFIPLAKGIEDYVQNYLKDLKYH